MDHQHLGWQAQTRSLRVLAPRLELESRLEARLLDLFEDSLPLEQVVVSQELDSAADEESSSSRPSYCRFV